jgi:hypothetical protein
MTVSYCASRGWQIYAVEEPGKIGRTQIEGRDPIELDSDMRTLMADPIRKMWLWWHLVETRQRE